MCYGRITAGAKGNATEGRGWIAFMVFLSGFSLWGNLYFMRR